ncbi:hypothetical protein [Nostoc sp. CCY 9925]
MSNLVREHLSCPRLVLGELELHLTTAKTVMNMRWRMASVKAFAWNKA